MAWCSFVCDLSYAACCVSKVLHIHIYTEERKKKRNNVTSSHYQSLLQ